MFLFCFARGDKLALKETKYVHNKSFLSLVGCDDNGYIIKLVTMKTVRNSNIDCDDKSEFAHYDSKMVEALSRARNKIFDLAMCNSWDYFFTGTLDKTKYDRYDLEKYHKDLTKMIRNFNSYHNANIKFLFIPEKHKDGAWHIHGLLSGVPDSELYRFKIGDKMSADIVKEISRGKAVFNWKRYSDKFGFCDLTVPDNRVAINKYITKYVSKELFNSMSELGAHLYYRSRGLYEPIKIKEGFMSCNDIKPTFESEYCVVYELPYDAVILEKIKSAFL